MEPKILLNRNVCNVTGARLIEGNLFGLELELEGRNVALNDVATRGWKRTHEPSLRGGPGDAIEYTTQGAKSFEETQKLVISLFKKFKEHKIKFKESIRTSTHVHLNFSDKPFKKVLNFFSLFTMLEEVLQYYSGEDRKGNLFCMSTREAEGIVGVLSTAVSRGDFTGFSGDRYKYSACNLSTLYKFGTIEVRTMRGATSAEQVNVWVSILNDMYEYSLKMVSPVDLIRDLSVLGADELMKRIFTPDNYNALLSGFPVIQTLHYSLMEGARILQVFAYEFDEAFKAENVEAEMIKKGNSLPARIMEGPRAGSTYKIYLPNGLTWVIVAHRGQTEWKHGDCLHDDPSISWDGTIQRFVHITPDGRRLACRWKRHHELLDEGFDFGDINDGEVREDEDDGDGEGWDEEDF